MMTTHPFNTLAIGQHTQVLNNRLNCRFDGINATKKIKSFFLISNNSSFQSKNYFNGSQCKNAHSVRSENRFLMCTNHYMGLNFKSRFLEFVKSTKSINSNILLNPTKHIKPSNNKP
jgi:hypothetical protein